MNEPNETTYATNAETDRLSTGTIKTIQVESEEIQRLRLRAGRAENLLAAVAIALEPLAQHIFNDNNDLTFNGPCYPTPDDCSIAYLLQRRIGRILSEAQKK